MTIDPQQAAAALGEIAGVEQRTRRVLVYGQVGLIMMLWGVLDALGYVSEHFQPRHAARIWLAVNGIGLLATVVLTRLGPRLDGAAARGRLVIWALLVLIGYGLVWSLLLGNFTPRQLGAFWSTLFMCGYVLLGLWLGRAFIVLGLAVTALTLIGYFWLGPWFQLWMAAVDGGGLILGGLWLRRLG